jgi:aquaporin Z
MLAGLAIGLTLVVIHIVGIQVTGVSVNPARSFGPAVFAQGIALQQLWLFLVAPLIGAGLAGLLFRVKLLEADAPAEDTSK